MNSYSYHADAAEAVVSELNSMTSLAAEKTIFVMVNLMDVVLTYLLLQTGCFYECNPIAELVLNQYGFLGMTMYKLLIVAGVLLVINLIATLRFDTSRTVLHAGIGIVMAVVGYSAFMAMFYC